MVEIVFLAECEVLYLILDWKIDEHQWDFTDAVCLAIEFNHVVRTGAGRWIHSVSGTSIALSICAGSTLMWTLS